MARAENVQPGVSNPRPRSRAPQATWVYTTLFNLVNKIETVLIDSTTTTTTLKSVECRDGHSDARVFGEGQNEWSRTSHSNLSLSLTAILFVYRSINRLTKVLCLGVLFVLGCVRLCLYSNTNICRHIKPRCAWPRRVRTRTTFCKSMTSSSRAMRAISTRWSPSWPKLSTSPRYTQHATLHNFYHRFTCSCSHKTTTTPQTTKIGQTLVCERSSERHVRRELESHRDERLKWQAFVDCFG